MGPVLVDNSLYRNLYNFFSGLLPEGWDWLAYTLVGLTMAFILANGILAAAALITYAERRVVGRFQSRLGPNRVGPFGLLQPIADVVKLLLKEDVIPRQADRLLFNLAPIVVVAPVFLLLAVIPFGKNSFLADVNIGILFVIAVTTVSMIGFFLAGWGSGNRYAMLGAMRAIAQLVSYEVPMVLSIVGVLLLTGSLSLVRIVEAQSLPFILLQPLGFFIFLAASSAELNRPPFDLLEAESEIVAGYHIEYSGMKWGLFQLAEFAAPVAASAIITTLFLRGWENPFVPMGWPQVFPSHLWFIAKTFFVLFLFIWLKATLPRLRIDQVLGFAWKILFPLAIVNLLVTAVEVQVWPEPTTGQLWAMAAINFAVAGAAVTVFGVFMERQRRKPTTSVTLVRIAAEVR